MRTTSAPDPDTRIPKFKPPPLACDARHVFGPEVEIERELSVRRLVAAADVGLAVNPDGVANQIAGGCIQATSWTLKEAWQPGMLGWEHYPIMRFSEVPLVEVSILESRHPSVGAGECSMGPTGAAIANALYDALGVRVRDLPLTADRIAAAL